MVRIFSYILIIILIFFSSCRTTTPSDITNRKPVEKEEKPIVPVPEKILKKPQVIEKKSFTMDSNTYKKTKEDIAQLINTLNKIIEKRDYTTWLTYLSKNYFAYYSDPEILHKQSESPLLKKYNITLRSLKDYFNYVVVGSRKNVRLDEIKALDPNHIKAYMFINNSPVIIYELVKIDNKWKIAHF